MRRYQPVILGALFIGVLSALPVVGGANYCCCLWVVVGGLLTAYLQQQAQPAPLEASEAAVSGLLAGLLGAVIYVVLTAVLFSVSGDAAQEQIRQAIESNPQIPADVRDRLTGLLTGGRLMLLVAAVSIPMYAIASMLGALLGLAIFKKKVPPAPPSEAAQL
jgi:hypothetical protein